MKVLSTSLALVPGFLLLTLAPTLHARYITDGTAVYDYTGDYNVVHTTGTVADASGTTAFGLRFTGTDGASSSYNTVTNYGTIISGTGASLYSAGIYFNGSENGQSNGNTVINYGTIIASNSAVYNYTGGILFNAADGGQTDNNTVLNLGTIQVSGSAPTVGIGFNVEVAKYCANNNTITNQGTINVVSWDDDATGIGFSASHGVANNNTIINNGTLSVTATNDTATGIGFEGYAGQVMNNTVINNSQIIVSGYEAYGIVFTNGTCTGNNIINRGNIQVVGDEYAVGFYFDKYGSSIDYNTISNYGTITVSGTGGWSESYGIYFGDGDDGDTSNHNTINNYGTISVNSADDWAVGIAFDDGGAADYNTINNYGTLSVNSADSWAMGIYFDTDGGSAIGNTLNNYGTILASASNSSAYSIRFESDGGPVTDNTINNYGLIKAAGSYEAIGVYFEDESSPITGNVINNYGTIVASGSLAGGIIINGEEGSEISGNVITNYGVIQVSAPNAYGIVITGSGSQNNTITNWGTISATGSNEVAAIYVEGNNNTITLAGHSSVTGEILASGSNNVLNLAFTGVSKSARADLIAQLNAIGALSGTASEGTFTFRGVTYTYDPLTVTVTTSSYKEQGKTPNQKAVGASLDSFTVNPTGDMLTLLNSLDWSGNVSRGLDQLSPQRYQIYNDIALSNASLLTGLVDQRLDNVRTGSESIDTSTLNLTYGSVQSKLGMGKSCAPASSGKESKEVITTIPEKRWSAFLSGNVGHASLDGSDDLQSSKFSDSGVIGGVDVKLTDAWTAGALVGYAHTDADMDTQGSNADVDAYSAGLYGGYREGGFYGNGLAAFTHNVYDSNRVVDISNDYWRNAHGHTDGSQWTFNLDGGYDQPVTNWLSAGPFAGIQYVHLGVGSFTESQAKAAALNVNDMGMDSIRSRLGVRVELRKDLSKYWKLASELRAAWQHEFADDDRAIVAQFNGSGLGSFAVRTSDPERDRAVLGVGLNATCSNTFTVFADYDAEVGTDYTDQIFKGGIKLSF